MAARSDDSSERCLLLELSHDELGVILDGLADPLEPAVAVALSSTCFGLRTPLRLALEVLKMRHERAEALCRKIGSVHTFVPVPSAARSVSGRTLTLTCAILREQCLLPLHYEGLTAEHMGTLGLILRTNGLPSLRFLRLNDNGFGDAGLLALCEGVGRGAAPSLLDLDLGDVNFGPAGAEALASALSRGAMPRLRELIVSGNRLGNQGVAALALSLRRLLVLKDLYLDNCDIGDEGVASLVGELGEGEFKALRMLWLNLNRLTDKGCATLVAAIDGGGMPKLGPDPDRLDMHLDECLNVSENPASVAASSAVAAALRRRYKHQ